SSMPLDGQPTDWDAILPEGKTFDAIPPMRTYRYVSPNYFKTTGTRIIAGREYTWNDLEQQRRYAMVSENLARELWGSPQAAIGTRVQTLPSAPLIEVVGVVEDVRDKGVQEPASPVVYWPTAGDNKYRAGVRVVQRGVTFVIRTRVSAMDQVRQA